MSMSIKEAAETNIVAVKRELPPGTPPVPFNLGDAEFVIQRNDYALRLAMEHVDIKDLDNELLNIVFKTQSGLPNEAELIRK